MPYILSSQPFSTHVDARRRKDTTVVLVRVPASTKRHVAFAAPIIGVFFENANYYNVRNSVERILQTARI
jgi:hypothetical protein